MPNVFAAVRHPTPHPIPFGQVVGRFADRSPSRVVGVGLVWSLAVLLVVVVPAGWLWCFDLFGCAKMPRLLGGALLADLVGGGWLG